MLINIFKGCARCEQRQSEEKVGLKSAKLGLGEAEWSAVGLSSVLRFLLLEFRLYLSRICLCFYSCSWFRSRKVHDVCWGLLMLCVVV